MDRAYPNRWLVLAIAAAGLFLLCVDLTVLYIALPALSRDLGASETEKLWILNAYPLVVAGLLPGMGTLGDRHGHRRLFIAGLCVFGTASLLAAFSVTPAMLVATRALLGVGAAMMMPASLAIIRDAFDIPQERSIAIGVWAGMASGGMALGPVIAGTLLEYFWWGSVFLINVPVVAVALLLTCLCIRAQRAPGGPPWDLFGSLLILGGLTALVFTIKESSHLPRSMPRMAAGIVVAAALLIGFHRRQQRRTHPLLDLSLFRLPGFAGATGVACLATAGAVGLELGMSQYLQLAEHRSPLNAALVFLPLALAGIVAGPLAGRLLHWMRPSLLAAGACWLAAICVLLLAAVPGHAPHFDTWRLLLFAGIGLGMGTAATFASTTIMNAAPAERAGMAASIEEVSYELGNALGVAVFGSLMTVVYTITLRLGGPDAHGSALRVALTGIGLLWIATGALVLCNRRPPRENP